jgi:hypothetical protein
MSEISDYIVHIKTVLRLNVSDIARLAGVSRQTIYDWQADRFEISPEHASYMRRLDHAANQFAEAGIAPRRHTLMRAIENGRSFFDIAKDGDPGHAAYVLIGILEREATERKRLRERFGERTNPVDWIKCGIPMFDERD